MSPRGRWGLRLAAAVLVPVFCLGLMELGLRVIGYGYATGFFLERKIEGTGYLIPNRLFTHRFFPSGLARDPLPFRMLAEKPEGTYRIFLFGESAAYGDPEPAYGMGRFLKALLEIRHPGTEFEVICTAVTAINSHVILPIARDCIRRDGDLLVLYMGNNEMVGPFGAGTVFGKQAPRRSLVKTLLLLRSTRLGQLLTRVTENIGKPQGGPNAWRGIDMFVENKLRYDDPGRLRAYRNFGDNLHEIVETGLRAGIPVLLSTVSTNLRDCAPFVSIHPTLADADLAVWEEYYQAGLDFEDRGLIEEAHGAYEAAAAIESEHAELQYRIGTCYLALGRADEAEAAFTRARDLDALAVRADTRINRIILDAVEHYRGRDLMGLDAAAILAGQTADGLTGRETFYEHVHFTVEGNFRLARLMADMIGQRLLSSPENVRDAEAEFQACAERLAFSLWDQKRVWNVALERTSVPPFTTQSSHASMIAYFEERMLEVDRRTTQASWGEVQRVYERAISRLPDDTLIRWNYAQFLERSGRIPEAIVQGQAICQRLPENAWPHFFVGSLMAREGRIREAVQYLRMALRIQPDVPFAREELDRIAAAYPKAM
ncbi:MAG: tetratricopeptide repeat protein [Opitutales bacterium]|nr:tetratricopeptide repeat protein [Opitutales bacterium]